ncbi:protein PLANT CADMIUM RESISTANCE 8-like [Zingiber officinale]|uniref:Uncharacterized protein n=1 Tax=Zingiber officinale TaxID=94328 RepID=A0A8J5F8E3_ZINOF|nr:protein PLANT CADMIUM RESISTANCE 8-like [Zingiber officinale]KAG6485249.1 hypothetical protein ZIOFF_053782 [Zingiber officinale]
MGKPQPAAAVDPAADMDSSSDGMELGPTAAGEVLHLDADAPNNSKLTAPPATVIDYSEMLPPPSPKRTNEARPNHQEHPGIGRPWTTGLFDCGRNETNAMLTAYCPCVTFGQVAEVLDEGKTRCAVASFMYLLMSPALCTCWILGAHYRHQLRTKYNLVQAPAEDWVLHLFCPCCALCQEYRELQNRGIDPSLGWMGYLAQQQETKTAAPESQSMDK